ncbi:MAG: hypothetical protein KBG85_08945 [Micropruina sp.]|nr:hypothetical protein [Micropruina sp.]
MPVQGTVPIPVQGTVPIPVQGTVPYPVQGTVPYPVQGTVPIPVQGTVPYPVHNRMDPGRRPSQRADAAASTEERRHLAERSRPVGCVRTAPGRRRREPADRVGP